ncbi:MAG: cupin domain-containing protein [Methylococcaceae bacterium]
MNQTTANIFKNIPEELPEELFESLLKYQNTHIERIVSRGHITADGSWYDQDWDEWVILLQGQATLLYQQNHQLLTLNAGDYLLIPAHTRHRVEWTPAGKDTIWLAVHLH